MSDIDANGSDPGEARPDRERLFEIASEQGGYFTTEQARGAGFSWALLSHHTKRSRFVRIRRGLYRLHEYPSSSHEDVLVAWLAAGKDTAVVSHESALDLLGLSDVIPEAVHLTVDRSRRNLSAVPGVMIHTTTKPFGRGDLIVRGGICLTAPARTILDAATTGAAPEQVELAVAQAIERRLTTADQLRQGARTRGQRVAALIDGALRETER